MNKFELYNFVFNDGTEYTDFYFNKRRNKVRSFEHKINGDTVALVNVADILIEDKTNCYKTALVTGLCTHPDMRNQGVMQGLFDSVLTTLEEEKYQLVCLSPANDNYYNKYNFTSLVKGDKKIVKYQKNEEFFTKNPSKIDTNLLLSLYNKVATTHNFYQKINEDILLDIVDEFGMNGASIQIICQGSEPIGWCALEGDKIELAILPDLSVLNKIKSFDNMIYFEPNINGNKDLFQIKILDKSIKNLWLNTTFLLSKY